MNVAVGGGSVNCNGGAVTMRVVLDVRISKGLLRLMEDEMVRRLMASKTERGTCFRKMRACVCVRVCV